MGLPSSLHLLISAASFGTAAYSLHYAVQLGAIDFLQANVIDGLLTDLLDGLFLNPLVFAAVLGLQLLPILCHLTPSVPKSIIHLTYVTAFPSVIILTAIVVQSLIVLLPLGATVGGGSALGWMELQAGLGKSGKGASGGRKSKGKKQA